MNKIVIQYLIVKRLLLVFFFIISSLFLFSNQATPDSLLLKYHYSKNDSIKVQTLREIVDFWKSGDQDSIMYYSKKLINEALKINNIQLAYKGYYWVINIYGNKGVYDSALHYAFNGLDHYLNNGVSYPSAVLLSMIGEQYRALAQHNNAIIYLSQAWIIADTGQQDKLKSSIANRLASVYYEQGLLDSTLKWNDVSISNSKKNNQHVYDVKNLLLRGAVMRDKSNYKKALESFNEALLILRETPDNSEISSVLNNISTTYSLIDDWNNVIRFAEESYQNSSSENIKALSMVSSELLANAYYEIGNFKQAYKYSRIYEQVRNEIFFKERDQQISELNTKYNLQQKENQIEIQNITIGKKDLQIKQNRILSWLFIFALLLLIVFLIFRNRVYKRLKKVNTLLTEKNILIVKQKTEIEESSKKIGEAYSKLQELDSYKQATTSMLVHDLKNPLNSLVNIDTYKSQTEKNSVVARTSKQMLRLVMNVLDINKAEDNRMKLDLKNVNLVDIIQSSFQEVNYLCVQKGVFFKNKLRFNSRLKADYDVLVRVFINLFTNAIKFSPTNSKIIINAEITSNKCLKVSVTDNGDGIAKEYHKTIFFKFRQIIDVKSRNIGSTGIGLAYCKLAVEAHGWAIGVESEPSNGAKFWILIKDFIIDDSENLKTKIDIEEVKEIDSLISESDKQKLKPYLQELLKMDVYAVSAVKKVLLSIKKENIQNIEPWLNEVKLAISSLNEEKYLFLIKSLLK